MTDLLAKHGVILTKQEGEDYIGQMEAKISSSGQKDGLADNLEEFKRIFFKQTFIPITLAFEPGPKFLKKVASWFSQNLGKKVILDVTVDKNIVGGAIVICNNHYKDYSLASKMAAGKN